MDSRTADWRRRALGDTHEYRPDELSEAGPWDGDDNAEFEAIERMAEDIDGDEGEWSGEDA